MNIATALQRLAKDGFVDTVGRMALVVLLLATTLLSILAASSGMDDADAVALESALTLDLWLIEVSALTPMVYVAIAWSLLPLLGQIGTDFEDELQQFETGTVVVFLALYLGVILVVSRVVVLPHLMGALMI